MDKNFTFETIGSSARRSLRAVNPDRVASPVSFELEKSEGVRPSVAYMPHKFSPTIKKIHTVSNEDLGIAIPKGTIVSAVPVVSVGVHKHGLVVTSGTAIANTTSGSFVVGHDFEGTDMLASSDHPLYGYGKVVNAAVIANGGANAQDLYTQYDVDTERLTTAGALVTTATTFTRASNIPVGLAMEDIYINREGQYLNGSESSFQLFDALLSDWLIAVPFVVNGPVLRGLTGAAPISVSATAPGVQTVSTAYSLLKSNGAAFLWADDLFAVYQLGAYVKSDLNGKFTVQSAGAVTALTASPTAQTVGKIVAIDTKFPKDLEDTVQNSPFGTTGGNQTYGLPLELYRVVYYVLTGLGATVNYDNILAVMNSGEVGIAWINLHIN